MLDLSWGEIMVIGGVALIVIGPKDLPKALRTVGQMTTKVRRMAGEFQSQFSEAMREADLEDVRKEVEGLNRDVASATSTNFDPIQSIRDELKNAEIPRHSPVTAPPAETGAADAHTAVFEDVGSVPQLEPVPDIGPLAHVPAVAPSSEPAATPLSDMTPDAMPLVPLPFDEPVLPAPDQSRLVTGPGLEPVSETERAKGPSA